MLGSVAERVLRTAQCPVLTVRDSSRAADIIAADAVSRRQAVARNRIRQSSVSFEAAGCAKGDSEFCNVPRIVLELGCCCRGRIPPVEDGCA